VFEQLFPSEQPGREEPTGEQLLMADARDAAS